MSGQGGAEARDAMAGTLVMLLERLVSTSMGAEGVGVVAVRDGRWFRVVASRRPGAASGLLDDGARATFSFTPDRVQGLVDLGVSVSELAQSAFGNLIDQLAEHAPDRVAFIRSVHRRLSTEVKAEVGESPR